MERCLARADCRVADQPSKERRRRRIRRHRLALSPLPRSEREHQGARNPLCDRVLETLKAHEVPRCVAFVIGSVAAGEEHRLEAWLDAGYELGIHAFDHARASESGTEAFLDSVA